MCNLGRGVLPALGAHCTSPASSSSRAIHTWLQGYLIPSYSCKFCFRLPTMTALLPGLAFSQRPPGSTLVAQASTSCQSSIVVSWPISRTRRRPDCQPQGRGASAAGRSACPISQTLRRQLCVAAAGSSVAPEADTVADGMDVQDAVAAAEPGARDYLQLSDLTDSSLQVSGM